MEEIHVFLWVVSGVYKAAEPQKIEVTPKDDASQDMSPAQELFSVACARYIQKQKEQPSWSRWQHWKKQIRKTISKAKHEALEFKM